MVLMSKIKNLRKVLSAITASALVIGGIGLNSAVVPEMNTVSAATAGDLNTDDSVNIADVVLLQQYLLNKAEISADVNADLTGDGKVNVFDFVQLKRNVIDSMGTVEPEPEPTENTIVLADAGITFTGTGAILSDDLKTITISEPGTYIVTGEMTGGQIVVDVDKTTYVDGEVELSLEGMSLTNTADSPIYVASIDGECIITAKKNTENTVSDGTSYTNADEGEGAIYACDDLKIKGKGTLNVNGNCGDGIVCKNDLKVFNGTVNVTAVDDGLRGKDSVKIGDADDTEFDNLNVTIKTSAGDGIKSNATDEGNGVVTVNGGTVNIDAYSDGIHAYQELNVNGGSIDIETTESKDSGSSKGLKSGYTDDTTGEVITGVVNVNGGYVNANTNDDCINSNGDINILGGQLELTSKGSTSGYQGIHADNSVTLGTDGGAYEDFQLVVYNAYEGIEAMNIYQKSGSTVITSADDAFNVAGGADNSGSTGGWPGQGGTSSGGAGELVISGGFSIISVQDGDHDGYDSNGTLSITGGIAITNGQEPFDCDGGVSYTGGVYIKDTGSGGMGGGGMMPGGGSTSMTESVNASCSITAGTRVTLCDGSGNIIVSFIADKNVSSLIAGCTAYSGASFYTGGELSGSTYFQELDDTQLAAYGGTLTGGTAVSGSSGGTTNPWG
ncbi:MAG: carbohydrate-binding domain-containing protein [Ruminococcus sp.]|nr:carbohydrate-binding domain-containing protein [Ruminococcus sp.]